MTITKGNALHDAGSVDGTTGNRFAGCQNTTPARLGVGQYTLTLDEALDAAQGICIIGLRGSGPTLSYEFDWASDTVLKINTFAAGVAADVGFDFEILNLVGV